MVFTSQYTIAKLSPEDREDLKFDNYTINLANPPYLSEKIYGLYNLVTIELLKFYTAKSEKLMELSD